ncbi:MAG: hypothetical protein WCO72_03970 [Betaproteobacteria bacterium]|jgi:hypothetical protein
MFKNQATYILFLMLLISNYAGAQATDIPPSNISVEIYNLNSKLATKSEYVISALVGYYWYAEPTLGLDHTGNKYGIDFSATKKISNQYFINGSLLYKNGTVDYSATNFGTAGGQPNRYYELFTTIGKDIAINEDNYISPYIGLGYRNLYHDSKGQTTTGAYGYRRTQEYYYIPIGLNHKTGLNLLKKQGVLESTIEYDYLLAGKNNTKYSDAIYSGYSNYSVTRADDLYFTQKSGFGVKLSTIYKFDQWSIGPYLNYWRIQNSDTTSAVYVVEGSTTTSSFKEPTNTTMEFGLKAGYRF